MNEDAPAAENAALAVGEPPAGSVTSAEPWPLAALPKANDTPPRVRLTVRVGVTGHRLNGLKDADPALLQARVREALALFRRVASDIAAQPDNGYSGEPPALRLISPVAEGSDRIVATEALALGYTL